MIIESIGRNRWRDNKSYGSNHQRGEIEGWPGGLDAPFQKLAWPFPRFPYFYKFGCRERREKGPQMNIWILSDKCTQ